MLSRDLISTMVRTFFEELGDVRDGGEAPYARFYTSYFKHQRDWFLQASGEEITAFLADDPIHKLEMLTELLYRDARSLTDADMQRVIYQKVLELYEEIDIRSKEFSMERMNRVAGIKQLLQ